MSRTSAVLLRTQSDERLVALARGGHERAFETIVRRYRRPLLAACRRMVDHGRAEDVLQQALLAAWGALRRGDDVRDLRAWLFRIVRNAAVSHQRRAGHDGAELVETLSVAAGPQEEAERRAVIQETLETIAGLPPRQREALLRIAVQGRSQDEVAAELGVSRVAVRQLVHRARSSLRATATAIAPLPLMSWAASAGAGESLSVRIASLVAGAGGAGAAATLAKAGAVAGVAATAASAPMIVEHRPPAPVPAVRVATAKPTQTARPVRTATAPAARTVAGPIGGEAVAPAAPRRAATGPTGDGRSRRGGESDGSRKRSADQHDDGAGDARRETTGGRDDDAGETRRQATGEPDDDGDTQRPTADRDDGETRQRTADREAAGGDSQLERIADNHGASQPARAAESDDDERDSGDGETTAESTQSGETG